MTLTEVCVWKGKNFKFNIFNNFVLENNSWFLIPKLKFKTLSCKMLYTKQRQKISFLTIIISANLS